MGQPELNQSAQLCAAFAEFEHASSRLAAFYDSLEQRVAELTLALTDSKAELQRELHAKGVLATRLASLLEALPGGVIVLDEAGRVTDRNPAAVELLGPVAIGEPWIDVVARCFSPRWDDGHDISLQDGRRVNVATQALHGEPGQILLIKDVTETRRLQELLTHHRRLSAKTELAAALAHQIRTPLSVAILQLSNLNRESLVLDARRRHTEKAMDAMRQLERLVEDMLTFARGGPLDMASLSVQSLLDDLARDAQQTAATRDLVLEIKTDIGSDQLRGNRNALHSIMLNLVNNSCNAMGGCGRMTISATRIHDCVELRFADHGPGIPLKDREHVFEPFFTTRKNGTGLGLSVARAVARAHGGELDLDPDYRDGACLVLTLPAQTGAPSRATTIPQFQCLPAAAGMR